MASKKKPGGASVTPITKQQQAPAKVKPLSVVGDSGLKRFGGEVVEEWHVKLRGRQGVRFYREMSDNDPVIGAYLFLIESLVRELEWRAEPASDENKAQEAAEFLETNIEDMSHTWDDMIVEAMTMLPFGWAYHELVYKIRRGKRKDSRFRSKFDDGRVGWRKIPLRAQDSLDRWEFDEDGGIRGMWQLTEQGKQGFIPIEKALLFRTKSNKNNPEGRSILRNVFRTYSFKKRIEEYEAIGIERDLAGLPVIEMPPEFFLDTADPAAVQMKTDFEQIIQQIRRDERWGLVFPSETDITGQPTGYKFRLMNTGGTRQVDTNAVIERHDKRMAMSVLTQFLFLGMSNVGSFALASSQTNLFSVALAGFITSIKSTLNRFAVRRLFELNPEFPPETWPTLEHGDIESPPLDEVMDYVFRGAQAGLIDPSDKALQRRLLEIGNLPEPEDEEK